MLFIDTSGGNTKVIFNYSDFNTFEVDTSMEKFVYEEGQRICNEDLLNLAPDQKCITHYPPIKRGRKYNSYFRTTGL